MRYIIEWAKRCSEYKKKKKRPILHARNNVRIQLTSQVQYKLAIKTIRTIYISAWIEENGWPIKNSFPTLSHCLLNPIERRAAQKKPRLASPETARGTRKFYAKTSACSGTILPGNDHASVAGNLFVDARTNIQFN